MSAPQHYIDVITAEERAGGRQAYYTETTAQDRLDMRRTEKAQRNELKQIIRTNRLRLITITKQDAQQLIDKVKQLGFEHELVIHELWPVSALRNS